MNAVLRRRAGDGNTAGPWARGHADATDLAGGGGRNRVEDSVLLIAVLLVQAWAAPALQEAKT